MKRTTLLTAALAIATFFVAASPAFANRDPGTGGPYGQYADGMNLYEYVRSNPVNCVDSTGLRLCFGDEAGEVQKEEIMKLVHVLAPNAKRDGASITVDKDGNLAQNLVKALADWKGGTVWLIPSDGNNYRRNGGNRDIRIIPRPDGLPGWYRKANDSTEEAQYLAPRTNTKEYALSLAHEMIHAYYDTVESRHKDSEVKQIYMFSRAFVGCAAYPHGRETIFNLTKFRNSVDIVQFDSVLREEEAFTVGLDVVKSWQDANGRTRGVINIVRYDATYTENKIAEAIGSEWRRIAYWSDQYPPIQRGIDTTDLDNWDMKYTTKNR